MDASTAIVITIALFVGSTLLGLPIGFAMISSSVAFLFVTGLDMGILADYVVLEIMTSPIPVSVPIFILAAQVMNHGNISDNLLKFCLALVGHLRGGLAQVNIFSSLIFSGMSGSSTADAAGIGRVMVNMMSKEERFPKPYSCAVTTASAILGPIFPPSIAALYYAVLSDTSVGALFIAGIVPAIVLTVAMMAMTSIIAKRRNFPVEPRATGTEFLHVMKDGIPALLAPVLLISGIYTGVFTPSEAATVMVVYSLLISTFYYRVMTWKKFYTLVVETVKISAFVVVVISGAAILNQTLTLSQIPHILGTWVGSMNLSANVILFFIMILYLILGSFIEMTVTMLVVTPVLLPAVSAAGVDLVHFGIVAIINMMIGKTTPPFGLLTFIVAGLNDVPVAKVFRELVPYIAILLIGLAILVVFPDLVLFLPRLAGLLQ